MKSYPAGHHESVLRSHLSRTAQNSAQHLLPYLRPGMKILDIGCGPGTITASLGDLVGLSGNVIGLDPSADVIEQASKNSWSEHSNVIFEVGDAERLRFEDSSFDVVHAHQVLQHVSDPTAILREMRRVAKKTSGGIVSLREGDLPASLLHPDSKNSYAQFTNIYTKTARATGADPQLGRKLHVYLRQAGFQREEVKINIAALSYGANNPEEAAWWGNSWAERCLQSGFHDSAIEGGHANEDMMQELSRMWREWGQNEDALWAIYQSEAICIIST